MEEIILGTGALEEQEDEREYRHEEIYSAPVVKWEEKQQDEWTKFPIRDQASSGSCVAQTVSKLLGTENKKEEDIFPILSALDIYDRRSNKPGAGMYSREGMLLGAKYGATLEEFIPSQKMTEGEMNKPVRRTTLTKKVGEILKGGAVVAIPTDNIDHVASVIQSGKCVAIGITFGKGYNQPVPQMPTDKRYPYRHYITGVDTTMWQGKKAIIVEDSWGVDHGFAGQRVILEDWFNAGKITSSYYYEDLDNNWMDKKEDPEPKPEPTPDVEKPKFVFNKNLRVGDRNNDVVMLQKCLQYLKFFPALQTCTGYFGGITYKSVKMYQEAYAKDILNPIGLSTGTGLVAKQTRAKLNEMFSK